MIVGFDTSNYTSSVAVFDGNNMYQQKQILSVKQGERGLRQSDAVFQHTINIPHLVNNLDIDFSQGIDAVGVSTRPRNIDGSYMPCFLVGENVAVSVSKFCGAKLYKTSHQVGHILAALYSANKLNIIDKPFLAFHVSGGTTDALLVTPDKNEVIKAELVAQSTDLKAGQAVDRTGVLLGLNFPCGKELEKLAYQSTKQYKIKPSMSGFNCSLSGVENKVKTMIANSELPCDICAFVIEYIRKTLDVMTEQLISKYGNIPIVFAGGVMSDTIIKDSLSAKYGAYFAQPQYSCDNAAGTAIYAYLKNNM